MITRQKPKEDNWVVVVPPSVNFVGFMFQCQTLGYTKRQCLEHARQLGGRESEIKLYREKPIPQR